MKKFISILILALISMGNALYLTINAFEYQAGDHSKLFCDVSETFSCSNLFAFDFAWIFGIPFPMIALVVYPIIAILAVLGMKGKFQKAFPTILTISLMGMTFNGYIIYNESVVGVFCLACLACSVAITAIAIISACGVWGNKK